MRQATLKSPAGGMSVAEIINRCHVRRVHLINFALLCWFLGSAESRWYTYANMPPSATRLPSVVVISSSTPPPQPPFHFRINNESSTPLEQSMSTWSRGRQFSGERQSCPRGRCPRGPVFRREMLVRWTWKSWGHSTPCSPAIYFAGACPQAFRVGFFPGCSKV